LHTANLQLLLKRQREKFVGVEDFQPLQEVWEVFDVWDVWEVYEVVGVENFQPLQRLGVSVCRCTFGAGFQTGVYEKFQSLTEVKRFNRYNESKKLEGLKKSA
jgi:hypothetical protein